eukprot:3594508-Prymnesium_polylepis.1
MHAKACISKFEHCVYSSIRDRGRPGSRAASRPGRALRVDRLVPALPSRHSSHGSLGSTQNWQPVPVFECERHTSSIGCNSAVTRSITKSSSCEGGRGASGAGAGAGAMAAAAPFPPPRGTLTTRLGAWLAGPG